MERVTIATLNIAAASIERAQKILDKWVIPSTFDVFVFTESSDGAGTDLIVSEFKSANWSVFRRTTAAKDRGVIIASRIQANEQPDYFRVNDPAPGRSIVINLLSKPVIQIIGMYVPNRGNDSTKNARKFTFLEFWRRHLQNPSLSDDVHRIVLGDLNVVPPSQQPVFLPQFPLEDDWYRNLIGGCDLYDAAVSHNAAQHEPTWMAHTGEGYTYDHILPQNTLFKRVSGFEYDHSTRKNDAVTDHSALIISFNLDEVTYIHRGSLIVQKQGALF